jgi:arginase
MPPQRGSDIVFMKTVSLIGAPTDVGASVRGAGMGPDALRVAGLFEALRSHQLKVIDHGNLSGPPTAWSEPKGGARCSIAWRLCWRRARRRC